MVKERVKKIHKVHHATSGNGLREIDEDSSSDFGQEEYTQSGNDIQTDVVVSEVTKALEKEGMYKFERKERGGHRKTVDYAKNIVKHTANFIVFVGGEDLLNIPIISISLILCIIKVIMRKLHVSVVNKYCDHLSDMGLSASKKIQI
jgi:hypothetical protein